MGWLRIVVWGVALFFAAGWTLGFILSPGYRLLSSVAAVVYWWCAIALAAAGAFSVLHLLWFMPLALLVSGRLMLSFMRVRGSIRDLGLVFFVISLVPVLGTTLAVLWYLSG